MSNKSKAEIDPFKEYTPREASPFLGLSSKQVARLIDAGYIKGRRRSPLPGSWRVVTGRAILDYIEMNV